MVRIHYAYLKSWSEYCPFTPPPPPPPPSIGVLGIFKVVRNMKYEF